MTDGPLRQSRRLERIEVGPELVEVAEEALVGRRAPGDVPIELAWIHPPTLARWRAPSPSCDRAPCTNVIVTGRDAPVELIDLADTATEMVKLRHAFDRGVRAKRGIEF